MRILPLVTLAAVVAASMPSEAQTKERRAASAALAPPPSAKRIPLGTTEEAKEVIKALRSIDAAVTSGINFQDYSKSVNELTTALTALDEVLEDRKAVSIRSQIAETLKPYQTAKDLWSFCVTSDDCSHNFINMDSGTLSKTVDQYLKEYPSANVPIDKGGALMNLFGPQVHWKSLLKAMWLVGGEKGKTLRSSLHSE